MTRADDSTHPNRDAFPRGVSGPALRALANSGIRSIDALAQWTEADLARLHGMGPKPLGLLKVALEERGRGFRAP
jgi:DNA-directed RNA polymerase alpha subunit